LIESHFPGMDYVRKKNLLMTSGKIAAGTMHNTISGRRLSGASSNGIGALTCQNQLLQTRLTPAGPSYRIALGTDILLTSTGVNCAEAVDAVTVLSREELKVTLLDDGTNGDAIAKDGIYSLRFIPSAIGDYSLDFGQGDILTISVYSP
ncbi:MAG TPA: choice-of-anchor X domain-containing protein, partial [Myxococcota bacterium]|nr:choice-of-anchor X domain-containing protein [Myxococcota bacterium]